MKSGIPFWVVGVLAAVGLPLLDPLTRARLWNGIIIEWGFPLLLLAVIAVLLLVAFTAESGVAVVLVFILGIGGVIFYGNARSYSQLTEYASTVTESDDPMPGLKERAPFLVAERQASSNLSGINGQLSATDYLPGEDRYSTLVDRNGPGNPGYAAIINQNIRLTGQATGKPCLFSDRAAERMDGFFGNSLTRLIAGEDTSLIAKKDDAWGYCDGDTPKVVVPVTRLNGWLNPIHTPAGVAVYDGKTGKVEIRSEVKAGELPGPAVGLSYVNRVNASLATRNGTWWSMVTNTSGITDQVKDENDPNKDNSTAFSLALEDGGTVYASPFTSRAASRSIEHVALLDSSQVTDGESPVVTLHRLGTPRQSNAATADKLKADYNDLSWASGLTVQEIIPAGDGKWAASIGLNQNVAYRVLVSEDGSSCLTRDGETVRCIDATGKTTGGNTGSDSPSADVDVPEADGISKLTDDQLAALQEAVTHEILARLKAR